MRLLKKSTLTNVMVFMTDATDHVTGKAGLTLTITASKDGAAFASIAPTVTGLGDGWYTVELTASHTDTLGDLGLHITATGADPTDLICRVIAADLADGTKLGLVALPSAAPAAAGGMLTFGTGSGQIDAASGAVTVATNNDKTGYSLSSSQTFNNTGTWTGNLSGSVGSVSGNVGGNISGSVGSVTAIVTANVTQMNGTALDGKADENFNVFFGNAGATTAKVVDDVGTGAGGSSDWTATEKNQIRYRLGLDGTTATPTATPTLGIVSADVLRWNSQVVATPNVAGVPIVDVGYVLGIAASINGADLDVNVVSVAGQTANASAAVNFSNLDRLDATISSRLASAAYTAPPTAADIFAAVLRTQLSENYATLGANPTLEQAIYFIQQFLSEFSISGTTYAVKKLDRSTTAATETLDSATTPTSITRTT